jgi:ABC-type amino acid transport substrate-binding protein
MHVICSDVDSSEISVLLEMARELNWMSVVYVGETSTGIEFLDRLLRYRRNFDVTEIVSVEEDVIPMILYHRIVTSTADFVLVHCQSYRCYGIVTQLFHLRNEKDSVVPWVMTEDLTRNLQSTISSHLPAHSTTYGLQKALPNSPDSDILLGDVWSLRKQCYGLEDCPTTLQQQFEVLAFYDSLKVLFHLIKDNKLQMLKHSASVIDVVNEANLIGISGAIRFNLRSSGRSIPTLYNVLDISPFLVANIGVYDTSKSAWLHKLRPVSEQSRSKRDRYRRAVRKCPPAQGTFRVATIIEPPFVIHDPNETIWESHNGPYTGLIVDILEWLAREIGFTYTMSEPHDLKYGSVNEDGESNGLVAQLMNCEVDLAAAAFAITSTRSQYIQFTKPYIEAGKTLLAHRMEPKSMDLLTLFNPFDMATRYIIITCLLVVTVAFAILRKLDRYIYVESSDRKGRSKDSRRRRANRWPKSSFWFLYTTFMQQGPDVIPSIAGKVLVAGWFFFALVIVAAYTANLAAFLTVKSFEDPIQSLHDLAEQTKTAYGTVKNTSITEFFATSPLEIHKRMHWYLLNTEGALVDTAQEAIDRVHYKTKGEYIFIWDEPILNYVASHKPCKSQVVGRSFIPQGYGFAMPKGMPYLYNFSLAILKMREKGIMESLSQKWLHTGSCPTPKQSVTDVTDAEELGISDMMGAFTILAATLGASFIIGLVELLWWRRRKMKKIKDRNGESHGQVQRVISGRNNQWPKSSVKVFKYSV